MPTNQDILGLRQAAIEFAREHLVQCCADLLTLSDAAELNGGKLRELQLLCEFAKPSSLSVAESIVKRAAFEFVLADAAKNSRVSIETPSSKTHSARP